MRPRALILPVVLALAPVVAPSLGAQSPAARDSAWHVLNRLAYGSRPGEVARVAAEGVMPWIDRQLMPERIRDDAVREWEAQFVILAIGADQLAQRFVAARRERAPRLLQLRDDTAARARASRPDAAPGTVELRRLGGQVQQLAVIRAVVSERQLYQVMVDFWTNHFNVFLAKGAVRYLLSSYIEESIRPHALGKFADLLVATAQSPAMLFYLDNVQSVAPGAELPTPAQRRLARLPADQREQIARRLPRGLNENYARELLELHTLGVDGGYTQGDVVNVARIFTGWGMRRPAEGAGFIFHAWAHDRAPKTVLGELYPAGNGMDEGMRLLRRLAGHHATMHHVSAKLCARFVADDPPDGCIDAAVAAWHRSDGEIAEVLRAIFRSPDFWAARARNAKVKTPLEFVVSAVRATGAAPDTTPRLAQLVARLGQPLYLQSAPTGWPEAQDAWVNAGALLARMNAAVTLAAGRLPGATGDLALAMPTTADRAALVRLVDDRLLGGTMSDRTRTVILDQIRDIADPVRARALAVGLALGGPEFQRQ